MKATLAAVSGAVFAAIACGGEPPPTRAAHIPVVELPETDPGPPLVDPPDSAESTPEPAPKPPSPPRPVAPQRGTPCDAAIILALQAAIHAREKRELAASMTPDGAFGCAVLQTGETVTVPITLQPGRCYSFLANSFPPVTEVDVFIKLDLGPSAPPLLAGMSSLVLAQDNTVGPVSAVGAGHNCFKNPMPIPVAAVAEVTAVSGNGPVAIQSYSH